MLKIIILPILFLSSVQIFAQLTYVPDDSLEQALIDLGLDSGPLDDNVATGSIDTLSALNVSGRSIQSMTGIEDFINLKFLDCSFNLITDLDISTNLLLINLNCQNNNLTTLDVSANSNLATLFCATNDLASLNLFQNLALDTLYCGYNQLTQIDFLEIPNIRYAHCILNLLTEIDLSAPSKINFLFSSDNLIDTINLSGADSLRHLNIEDNLITSLNTDNCTILEFVNCDYNSISSLDFTNSPMLKDLYCGANNINSINVSTCANLEVLMCEENPLSFVNIDNCPGLKILGFSQTNVTYLDLSQKTNLIQLHCSYTPVQFINVQNGNNESLVELYAGYNPDLVCIKVDSIELALMKPFWLIGGDYSLYSETCFLNANEDVFEINLYPNPAINFIQFETTIIGVFEIINYQGQIVAFGDVERSKNFIDISYLIPQNYIFRVISDDGVTTSKFLKQ